MIIYSDPSLTGHDPQLTSPDKYERQILLHDMEALQSYSVSWPVGTLFATIREKFEFELAPSDATDYHLMTEAGLRLYHLTDPAGHWYMDAIGAAGDGVTDDQEIWRTALLHCPDNAKLTFIPGKTYLISAGNDFQNDLRTENMSAAKNLHIVAHGAILRLAPFTGTELLHILHNPGAANAGTGIAGDTWSNDPWEFTWEGGTIDGNGQNQNFRHASTLRDGSGSVAPALAGNPQAEAAGAASAAVFGPGGAWEINPASVSITSGPLGALIRCFGASRMTVRDLTLRNLAADGIVAINTTGSVRFSNCQALDCLPTNDQYVITYVNGGDAPGSQLTAFKVDKPRSRALLGMSAGGVQPAPGDTVVGLTSGCRAKVSSISGQEARLFDVEGREPFLVGEELEIEGVSTDTQVQHFRLVSAVKATWDGCYGANGNILLGFVDTSAAQYGSVANVENCYAIDQGTCAARFEHVHTLNINNTVVRCSHLCADGTRTLHYGSQSGINIGGGCAFVKLSNLSLYNARINGTDLGQRDWEGNNITIEVTDTDPILNPSTGSAAQINAIEASRGRLTNIRIRSVLPVSGIYPIDNAITFNRGEVSAFEIDGCQNGLVRVERGSGPGAIRNAQNTAITAALATDAWPVVFQNIDIEDCALGIAVSASSGASDARLALRFRRIQSNCIACASSNLPLMVLDGCLFQDWGLDASLTDAERCAIGGDADGLKVTYLQMDSCTFHKIGANCSNYRFITQNGTEHLRERNTMFVPRNGVFLTDVNGATTDGSDQLFVYDLTTQTGVIPNNSTHSIAVAGPDGVPYYVPAFSSPWSS